MINSSFSADESVEVSAAHSECVVRPKRKGRAAVLLRVEGVVGGVGERVGHWLNA